MCVCKERLAGASTTYRQFCVTVVEGETPFHASYRPYIIHPFRIHSYTLLYTPSVRCTFLVMAKLTPGLVHFGSM